MLLYVLRHGLTPWNHLHKAQGSADIPLAQEGIDLAKRTGEALMDVNFDMCFTSPLTRARQTASLVLGGREVLTIPDKRIQEINFGDLEGHIMRKGNSMESDCGEFDLFFRDPREISPVRETVRIFRMYWIGPGISGWKKQQIRLWQIKPYWYLLMGVR